tara:strand:- start:249 stop:476 length:228 start_codon:yes stop_codon:yes gene_type:complete
MRIKKHIFFDTELGEQGHASIYEKDNGNIYIVFFIEEKYNTFREFTPANKLVEGPRDLGYELLNKEAYDKDFRRI